MSRDILMGLSRLGDDSADIVGPPPQQLKRMADLQDEAYKDCTCAKGIIFGLLLSIPLWALVVMLWIVVTG